MRTLALLASLSLVTIHPALANKEFIWGVSGAAGAPSSLYAINPVNGKLLGRIGATGAVTLSGLEVKNGRLYAAQGQLSPTGADNKRFYLLNKTTAAASPIGVLDPKYAISDIALRKSDGAMFAFGISGAVKKLMTVDTTTGAVTEIGAANNITNVSLTFLNDGTLCLVRTNGFFTLNPANGANLTGPFALSGATTTIDNFMATNSAGTIYCGQRSGANTALYTLDPTTRVTTLVGTVVGAALSGMTFDSAAPPVFRVTGNRTIRTTRTSAILKGTAKSLVPLTVSAKKTKTQAKSGKWTLRIRKLKTGRNRVSLVCDDGLGQKRTTSVVVIRE